MQVYIYIYIYIFIKRKGGHSDWSNQEVTSEKIELWAAVLKYLGFRSQVEVDDKQFWKVVQYEIWSLN